LEAKHIRKFANDYDMDRITSCFMEQLEQESTWKWALFVCLFFRNDKVKEYNIKRILSNWYPTQDYSGSSYHARMESSDFEFITKELKISSQWIHEAKSLKSRYENNNREELVSLLDSHEYSLAYQLFMTKIVPSRVLSGKIMSHDRSP
jgi:hypothetical protein